MDQLGVTQLFLIAKVYVKLFPNIFFRRLWFFNHITGLGERPSGADAGLHSSRRPRHWPVTCLGQTDRAQRSPAGLDLQQLTSFGFHQEGDETAAEDGRVLMHRTHFLTGNCFKTIQYLCCWSSHWRPTERGFLISSFSTRIVHRAALIRDLALFCVLF